MKIRVFPISQTTLKFVCDRMLGTLAKWLRLLGFDVLYPAEIPDEALDEMARDQGRILLTRDRELAYSSSSASLLLSSLDTFQQLREVDEEYGVISESARWDMVLKRCSVCNTLISKVEKGMVEGKVPEGVFSIHEQFWHCPRCHRYYWSGTHREEILKRIETLK